VKADLALDMMWGPNSQNSAMIAQTGPSGRKRHVFRPVRRPTAVGVGRLIVHICASPHLDHAAARDIGFRCVWIDRGTGRTLLPDYTPDATLATLDQVPALFAGLGW
jgi:2-haloacid dehalogenase